MTTVSRVLLALIFAGLALIGFLLWDSMALMTGWGLPQRSGPPMLVIAHRGDMEHHPEDTAEAIWAAAALGADGVEFDVHMSADDTWWVMHDGSVDRTTNGTGAIRELTDAYLAHLQIDAGPGFDPNAGTDIAPSQLGPVLAGLAGFHGEVYVDLQHAAGGEIRSLIRSLEDAPEGLLLNILCRDEADIQAIHGSNTAIRAVIRPDRVLVDSGADGFLLESVREMTADRMAGLEKPIIAFTDEAFDFLSEEPMLRRSWALGVHAFLAKNLGSALDVRDELRSERP